MSKRIAAIVTVAALGIGGAALAGGETKSQTKVKGAKSAEMDGMNNKELTVVEIYLDSAEDNARVLEFLIVLPVELQDRATVKELQKNVNGALEGAIKHAGKIKMTDDTANKELVAKLKDAKTAAKKLRSAKEDQLSTSAAELSSALHDAETSFDTVAQDAGYTKMEAGEREKQPVRGGTPEKAPDEQETPPKESPDTLPEPAPPTAPPSDTNRDY